MLRGTSPGGQPFGILGIDRDVGLGYGRCENLLDAGSRGGFQLVQGRLGGQLGRWLFGQLIDQGLDLFMILGIRPSNHLTGLSAGCESCVREGSPQEGQNLRCLLDVGPFQCVNDGRGRFARAGLHFFQHLGNRLVVCLRSPCQDRAGCGVAGETHFGQQLLEHLDCHGEIGVRKRVRLEDLLPFARSTRIDLFDRRADSALIRGPGPNHHFPGLLVDHHFDVRKQFGKYLGNSGRFGCFQRVRH